MEKSHNFELITVPSLNYGFIHICSSCSCDQLATGIKCPLLHSFAIIWFCLCINFLLRLPQSLSP